MRRTSLAVFFFSAAILSVIATQAIARDSAYDPDRDRGPVQTATANPHIENRVHNAGKLWMNVTNYGYFGNSGPAQPDRLSDPCPPGNWAPQAEFPGGSHQQYLFQGALWIGALIDTQGFQTKRVSVGTDGWFNPSINEMYPGEGIDDGIKEKSNRPGYSNCMGIPVSDSTAVSDQDFIAVMADTLTDPFWLNNDPIDGLHSPLGIKITQSSYSFSQAFAEDFILIDYEIENIASNFLKNLYVGLYVDADCGLQNLTEQHTDDICGYKRETVEPASDGGDSIHIPIDVAWIADNDGRNDGVGSGPLTIPHVTGTRVIRAPNPRLATSFNWWISNGDEALDYGPAWQSHAERDSLGLGWTCDYGTPVGDEHKYQVMGNKEFDFWQISVDELTTGGVPPDTDDVGNAQPWATCGAVDPGNASDIADGYDTRYLLSWGPLGVLDYIDQGGNRVYRLNHGEKFKMTIAYLAGEYFHNPNNPQPSITNIDSSLFNFADMELNAKWAKDVYDNRMFDTPQFDWGFDGDIETVDDDGTQGDGEYETGDGWFGEDVGQDGLYAILPPNTDSVEVYYFKGTPFEIFAGWYTGPDAGERDGRLDLNIVNPYLNALGITSEDNIMPENMVYNPSFSLPQLGSWDMGFMANNGQMDLGDGLPDFTGPPPPPIPALMACIPNTNNSASHFGGIVRNGCYVGGLGYELTEDQVILRWSTNSSESNTYRDPFSRQQDFEGYRIHVADINQENAYSLLAQFDKIDYAYFTNNDSMMTYPVDQQAYDSLIAAGAFRDTINNIEGFLRPVGLNTGFEGGHGADTIVVNDSTYEFHIDAHALAPRYYAITAFDYGDPASGLGPLTTRATTNAVLLAPARSEDGKVRVVPNPYRAYQDYTAGHRDIQWENQNDGTTDFFPQVDRRIEFTNLPERALIRIFSVAGDLVKIVPHNVAGDRSSWPSIHSEKWDLNSRNNQQVVSGIYMFSVEDLSDHSIETGKFVIIR